MRFKYKPDCSIPNLPKRDRFILAGFIWGNAVASATTTKVPVPIVVVWTGWTCVHRVVSKLRYHFWYISLRLREYNTRTLYVSAPPVRGRLAVTRTKGFILCAESSATPALILQRTSWSRASSAWSIAAMTPRASRSRWARAPRHTSTSSAAWARSRAWRASFPTSTATLPAVSAIPVGPPTASPPSLTLTPTPAATVVSPSSTTASSRTSPSCAKSWRAAAITLRARPIPRSSRI